MKSHTKESRRALLSAFSELALSERYTDFGVSLIVSKARVARSTFYYHFRRKDDLLVENLRPMLSTAAQLAYAPAVPPEMQQWTAHIWEHRATARRVFAGSAARRLASALTEEIEARFDLVGGAATRPSPLLAHQIAGSMISVLQAWVGGRAPASPGDVAWRMWAGARALAGTAVSMPAGRQ